MRIRKIVEYFRFIRELGPGARGVYVRMHLQLAFYSIWCKLSKREFSYCPYELPPEAGSAFVVEKGIPGVGITMFGRTFWLTTPMALKYKRVENPESFREHNSILPERQVEHEGGVKHERQCGRSPGSPS